MRARWLIGFAVLLIAGLAQAAVYKWVDDNGRVHYSSNPPPSGNVTQVKIRPTPPTARAASESPAEAAPAAGTQSEQPAAAEAPDAPADQARQEALRKNCEIARGNLKVLEDPAHRRFRDDKGNITSYSDADRQARIDLARKHVEEFCAAS